MVTETMQERADKIRPRIRKLMDWLAEKRPSMNFAEESEEISAAEALISARWLDYVSGGPDEPVKDAILKWARAHT